MQNSDIPVKIAPLRARFAEYLALGMKPKDAAAKLNISLSTAERWAYRRPDVRAAVNQLSAASFEAVAQQLSTVSTRALACLTRALDDPDTPPGARVAAARTLLEMSLRYRELVAIEQRMTNIERQIENAQWER